ncbi:hypothetical protein GGI25_005760 [Coemansia spiralis]|uniref:FHA domain-containing protein n=2 Tax=Coemansia TaxID=4863 RepID=A0A9W8FY41_9FUNG|nr:hypothetical protein EDC05_006302 [Coemansia umbellata]KAJ2618618.1 hypothetical protein GGI26_006465 [Coemansia sp. RSA 1358]KAJ2670708.1 hypothetical protein GGI25_005760 [Coemansia spiralis]
MTDKHGEPEFKVPSLPKAKPKLSDKEGALEQFPALKYQPPSNASIPNGQYSLEVIKDGSVVENHKIPQKASTYFSFGRLPVCDFPMDHASISRYHAVLQFTNNGETASLVDLESGHGSFVNKQRMQANIPYRLDIGDQIRFGMSTRIWVFCTDDEDVSAKRDSDLDQKAPDTSNKLAEATFRQHKKTNSAPAYARNPVKHLSSLLEENDYAYDPEFSMDDTGNASDEEPSHSGGASVHKGEKKCIYAARIALPFSDSNGNPLYGAARAAKRQDAERLACLDALQALDKLGYLSANDPEHARISSDIYNKDDSDKGGNDDDENDMYYDRTIKSSDERDTQNAPETFDTLVDKLARVNADISKNKQKLDSLLATSSIKSATNDEDIDELDAYMNTLAQEEYIKDQKQLSSRLDELRKHKDRLEALIKLVAPDEISSSAIFEKQSDQKKEPQAEKTESVLPPEIPTQKRRLVYGPTREDLSRNIAFKFAKLDNKDEEWQPPADQSGDGRTSLNEKYGY